MLTAPTQWDLSNSAAWIKYVELETQLEDFTHVRAILELGVAQFALSMPEPFWKAYIDFETEERERERGHARALYERLVQASGHVKVWISYAPFEAKPIPVTLQMFSAARGNVEEDSGSHRQRGHAGYSGMGGSRSDTKSPATPKVPSPDDASAAQICGRTNMRTNLVPNGPARLVPQYRRACFPEPRARTMWWLCSATIPIAWPLAKRSVATCARPCPERPCVRPCAEVLGIKMECLCGLCCARASFPPHAMSDSFSPSPQRPASPRFTTLLLDRSIVKLWRDRPANDAPPKECFAWGARYCKVLVRRPLRVFACAALTFP